MYVVGSDQLSVLDQRAVPEGRRHGVTADGRVLCRSLRPRFTWPALSWTSADDDAETCPLCIQVHRAEMSFATAPAYPSEAVVPVRSDDLDESTSEPELAG